MIDGPLSLEPLVVATILAMAIVTYATKAGGLWVLGRLESHGHSSRSTADLERQDPAGGQPRDDGPLAASGRRLERVLGVLPGAIVVSIVAAEVLEGGLAEWLAGIVVATVAWKTENLLLAILAGVVTVLVIRGGV